MFPNRTVISGTSSETDRWRTSFPPSSTSSKFDSKLTIHLLVDGKIESESLKDCMESVLAHLPRWFVHFWVASLGMSDDATKVCREYQATIQNVTLGNGMDAARNQAIGTGWTLHLEPWERLVAGGEDIVSMIQGSDQAALFRVFQGDTVSQQVRMFRDSRFVNPVYEKADCKANKVIGVIVSVEPVDHLSRDLRLADSWVEKNPANPEPFYYRACLRLSSGDRKGFFGDAMTYLFMERTKAAEVSMTMMRYYVASAHCYGNRDASKAIQYLAPCLLTRPLMAEFWCLLGDIYYHLIRRFDQAMTFYENAMILGSRRLADDDYPMEISKYGDHPIKMIESCRGIIGASTSLGSIQKISKSLTTTVT